MASKAWQHDRLRALAIERLLMIVGEAFVRIRSADAAVLDEITDANKIIGMRNALVHGYDAIDPVRIQAAIEESLPRLIAEIDALLGR